MAIKVLSVESMPFAENSYVVWRDGTSEAIVIDPGFEPDAILQELAKRNLTLVAIVNTHGHVDHIAGNGAMKEAFPAAPIIIGTGDASMLTNADLNLSGGYGFNIISPPAEQLVNDNETITLAGIEMLVREVPGHSAGHVVFYIAGERPMLLGGDVLFSGSIGRTDFPGGSLDTLLDGIRKKLWILPPETIVYPGHGGPTTIGDEKRTNPFLK
ncbi:MBL fold metallo-hydrolase [soil metagenome]